MIVSTDDSGRDPRIVVSLGGEDHVLSIERATQLRDALTRELGAPQALTDREAMVWAAEFVRAMAEDVHSSVAARSAATVVAALRKPSTQWVVRHGDQPATIDAARAARAMLAAMTGGAR